MRVDNYSKKHTDDINGISKEEWKDVYFKWNFVSDYVWRSIDNDKNHRHVEEFEAEHPKPEQTSLDYQNEILKWEEDKKKYTEEKYKEDYEKVFLKMEDLYKYLKKLGMPI